MPIRVFNENRLTCQPFFLKLINYLHVHEDVTLRQIHKVFEQEKNLDRQLDSFIAAGFVWREDKRYGNNFKVFTDADVDLASKTSPVAINVYEEPFLWQLEVKWNRGLSSLLFSKNSKIKPIQSHYTFQVGMI